MEHFFFDLSVLLACVGLLSCVAVLFKQPIIIAYILTGVVIGPWGMGLIKHVEFLEVISRLGITLLLFLAGLNLPPQKLLHIFRKTALVTLSNCAVSFVLAFGTAVLFRFSPIESMCIGLAMMFSSTILAVKLLPTTELHHTRIGAACIGVLILQDLLAIAVLAFIRCLQTPGPALVQFSVLSLKLTAFIAILFLFEFYVLRKVMGYVDRLQEVIFILGLGWCFGIASLSHQIGLFYETGAFFAGVVLASHKISLFISERLKPLRDFFLVLFFFTLGAKIDLFVIRNVLLPASLLTAAFVFLKPIVFRRAFVFTGESFSFSREAGIRLGQLSEFSLLIAILALEFGAIGTRASQLIQITTILTFIVSSYIVVFQYPTPIGTIEKLTRD